MLLAIRQLGDPPADGLAEGQRRGVLKVGAADFDHVSKSITFALQRSMQLLDGRQQVFVHGERDRDVHGRWE